MSAKARLGWLLSAAYRSLVSSSPPPRTSSFERQEPSLGGRAAPSLAPQDEEDFDEDEEEDEEEEAPAARAPRKKAAPRAPARKSSDKFELPSVSVLTAPKASDRQPLSKAELEANSRALEGVLGDFGVRGEIVKAQSRPGRDAVRTRARARHQIVARHRPGRRHRPLDERALGARRRGPRPQRHRHRTAERASRKGLLARIADREGRQVASPNCRSASARTSAANPSSSISRARRIC